MIATDETIVTEEPSVPTRTPDLRPVVGRLEEIARKCDSMGSRNREFPDMASRVRGVLEALHSGAGDEVDYRELARRLFPVARLFESVGFQSVAREIAHVERSLETLAPPAATTSSPGRSAGHREPVERLSGGIQATIVDATEHVTAPAAEDALAPRERTIPVAVVASAAAAIVTLVVCAVVVVRYDPLHDVSSRSPLPPSAVPTPSPAPRTVPRPNMADPARTVDRERLVESVSAARQALQNGDSEAAIEHLNGAAVIDPSAGLVLDVAGEIIAHHLDRAERALDHAAWDEAESEVAEAALITRRFGLDSGRIDAFRRRLDGIERYRLIEPDDKNALRAAIGLPVEVHRSHGAIDRGILDRVEAGELVLKTDRDMGGGSIRFLERIPLDDVRVVKAYPG